MPISKLTDGHDEDGRRRLGEVRARQKLPQTALAMRLRVRLKNIIIHSFSE